MSHSVRGTYTRLVYCIYSSDSAEVVQRYLNLEHDEKDSPRSHVKSEKKTNEEHSDVNIPINSGVPLSAVIRTPGTSSSAKPKSMSLISQLSLLTHTMFSGLRY